MQAENITDGVAAAVSHPVTVQVINQGPAIWGNVATGLITAGAAIAAVMLTHRFTLRREKQVSEDKLLRERYYIGTELVFLLERFGEECVAPSTDYGNAEDEQGLSVFQTTIPEISFTGVKGDWRSLPPLLMYRLRELEVMLAGSHNVISAAFEHDEPPYFTEGFFRHRQQATRLGIRAFILSAKLRKLCNMPRLNITSNDWSAPARLWLQYREQSEILSDQRSSRLTLSNVIARAVYNKRNGTH